MKRIGLFILGLCTIFLAGNFTQAKDYEYTNLDITANILVDGTIDVKEDFSADFFVSKHGIIRDIPLNYSVEGKDFHINVSDIYVQGKNFTTSKNNGNIEIKIGDADRTVIGEQSYPISYSTYGLIRNFSGMGYAELYWNLVGYDFDTNINKVKAEIILPKTHTKFTKDDFLITTNGTAKTIDAFEGSVDWKSHSNKIIITYNKGLSAHQGITLAIKFPNNYFTFDHERQKKLAGHIHDKKHIYNLITITTISLLIMTLFTLIKNREKSIKNEFKRKYPVIIQYNPPLGLNSAEVGILLHRYIDYKDTFSLIYKWAYEGIIKIQSGEKNSVISLVKFKDIPSSYPKYEKNLFNKLFFQNNLNLDNNTHFYNYLTRTGLSNYGIEQGRFVKKQIIINIVGCIWILFLFIGTPILFNISTGYGIISIIFLRGIGFFGGEKWLKPKTLEETEKGAKLISHILGYEKFLKSCDENKLKALLETDPLYFDKILPYAVVFGLETKLIKKIKPIMQELNIRPTRYDGDYLSLCTTISNISSFTSNLGRVSSYSSGGGHSSGSSFDSGGSSFDSGGGGGGGGGRIW